MKVLSILHEMNEVPKELRDAVQEVYRLFDDVVDEMSDQDGEKWDEVADRLDYELEQGNFEAAEAHLSQLHNILDDYVVECEEIWVDESGNEIITEAAKRAFKRIGKEIKRRYRCTTGPKKGKVVSNPILCATRKDPKKVRHGRKIARTRKGVRVRKSRISKRTSMSKMVRRMNQRLSGKKGRKPKKTK